MKKDDRNTFLLVAIILIVCIVSLVAIFNILWRVIADPIVIAYDKLVSATFVVQGAKTADYNFEVPELAVEEKVVEETGPVSLTYRDVLNTLLKDLEKKNPESFQNEENPAEEEDKQENSTKANEEVKEDALEPNAQTAYNYNFGVPEYESSEIDVAAIQSFPDAIIEDATLAGYGQGDGVTQVNLQIRIPKIGVNSPVVQGLGADDLLEQGFWVHPGSFELGEGEVTMLCHRRFFGPYDPRSCWFLDSMSKGDEILLDLYDLTLEYRVVGVNVFNGDDPLIYTFSPDRDYIKLVTCTPLYSNEQRLVVLAERVR